MDRGTSGLAPMTLLIFGAAALIGSSNFIGVRTSNTELAPFFGAGLRFALAAVLFALLATLLRLPVPRGRLLADTVLYGVFSFAVSYACMYWALVRVTAGVGATVLGMVPLVALLLAALQGMEPLRGRAVAGAMLAFAGIAVMALGPGQAAPPAAAIGAMLAAALSIGQSMVLGKRLSACHPAMTNAVGMSAGAALLLGLSAAAGEAWAMPARTGTLVAVGYLVVVGSVALFALTLLLMRRWTVSASSYLFVLFPVLTLALGRLVLGEPVPRAGIAGALLVMAAVWFGALSPAARAPAPAAVAEAA